jgi:homopolymeric O-antigen transport system ATP-binding protein
LTAVELEEVSKQFRLTTIRPPTTLKTALLERLLGRHRAAPEPVSRVLHSIDLTIPRGQTFGIIGRNGSGKSTLLKLMAGIYRPDAGRIRVHGRVAGLLELGAGFHPDFSGRENVLINGIVLGLSRREVRERFDDIVRFAELESFIDAPVRTYSSGMYTRLGFSVAIHTNPDVLLIDEILSVGDENFQRKCIERIEELQRRGKTIVIVSHDVASVARWCHEVAWLDQGGIREIGDPQKVIEHYHQAMLGHDAQSGAAGGSPVAEAAPVSGKRWGTGEVEITRVLTLDGSDQPCSVYPSGERMTVEITYKVHRPVEDVNFSIALLRGDGLCCFETNTEIEGVQLPALAGDGSVKVVLATLPLTHNTYYLDVAARPKNGEAYDHHSMLYPFRITSDVRSLGILRMAQHWTVRPTRERNEKIVP